MVAALPPFVSQVERVTAADLRWSWHAGCPVGPAQLRRVRLAYVGFDGKPHRGRLIVNAAVVEDVVVVFKTLYDARFPIRRMLPIDVYHGSDDRAVEADDTSSFNCRAAVAPGPKHWSMHAYGEAIDVNEMENPYVQNGTVSHANARPFLDRARVRAGMAVEGGILVRAFAKVGWGWGGRWSGAPDYQHFSTNGH
jgi:D-alanyl-D-alanine carboxypeptidase-like protein